MDYKTGIASMVLAAALGRGGCAGTNVKTVANDYENIYGLSDTARDLVFNSAVKVDVEYEYEIIVGETKTAKKCSQLWFRRGDIR